MADTNDDRSPERNNPPFNSAVPDDADLLLSLNQLSLSSSTAPTPRSHSRTSSISPHPPVRNRISAERLALGSPTSRNVPRSPAPRSVSSGLPLGQSRSTTPTLLRTASVNSTRSANGGTPTRASPKPSGSRQATPLASKPSAAACSSADVEKDEKPPQNEANLAGAHFKRELEILHGQDSNVSSETLVVLHDSCYEHRYSRLNETKGDLLNTVERPERLQATAFGVALAYVRLGGRHHGGKFEIHPDLEPSTISSIPFRIQKTDRKISLDSPIVRNVHGTKWMEELKIMCDLAGPRLSEGKSEMERPDIDRGVDAKPPEKLHSGDMYLCAESLSALEGALGAVCEAIDTIFSPSPVKRAFVAVRPPGHHCTTDKPQGFCWLNNVHVGIAHAFMNHGLTHTAIIDIDLHHGDGSQAIAWDHNQRRVYPRRESTLTPKGTKSLAPWMKTSIGYFSLHDINSYPCENGDIGKVRDASLCLDGAHGQSIWNVHLQEWQSEAEFWSLYQTKYFVLLEKAREYLRRETKAYRAAGRVPKAAIFLSSGFDASEYEGTGMQRHTVNVPTEFYARMTRDVIKLASEEGLAVDGRIISVLEGGYSDRALASGVLSHLSGLANNAMSNDENMSFPYHPSWWSRQELDRADNEVVHPEPPRPPRNSTLPTYSSPTQSSSAKVVAHAKSRRSISGMSVLNNVEAGRLEAREPSLPTSLDVHWPTAARELSKLLIPTDRTTTSITWEQIKLANRQKQQRQSLARQEAMLESENNAPVIRKSTRERKPVKPLGTTDFEDSSKSRRRTVAGASVLIDDKASARGIHSRPGRPPGRRLSAVTAAASPMDLSSPVDTPSALSLVDTAMERPSSSNTVRPESSMSVRTQATVKGAGRKPRPAAPARKDSSRANATGTKSIAKPTSTSTQEGIDAITGGIGKIKINLVTKEMREARLKAEEEKKVTVPPPSWGVSSGPDESTIAPAPASAASAASAASVFDESYPSPRLPENAAQGSPLPRSPNDPSIVATPNSVSPPPQPEQLLTPKVENFPAPIPVDVAPATPQEAPNSTIFIPYQPEGPTPQAIRQSAPVNWLPVNAVDSPAEFKRGHQFTATSTIPFAAKSPSKTKKGVETKAESPTKKSAPSDLEIPESPQPSP